MNEPDRAGHAAPAGARGGGADDAVRELLG